MKNKVVMIILAVALVLVLVGAYVLYDFLGKNVETDRLSVEENMEFEENGQQEQTQSSKQENEESKYTKAPDFTVYDEEGNAFRLSDFEGKPVVLNFWASWCGPCKLEMPDFDEAYGKYGEDIHFLMVNMTDGYQENVESAKEFIDDSGYSFPVYYDTDVDAARTYGVYSIPTTYFIDKDGYVIANGRGALDAETLQIGIDYIYDGGQQ